MTGDQRDAFAPTYRDRATAMRIVLAMLCADFPAIIAIADEAKNGGDVTRLILALADELAMLLKKAAPDPVAEAENWIAWELAQAEKHGQ